MVFGFARIAEPNDQQGRPARSEGDLVAGDQFGTADLSVGGSAGVPSGCSSLKVNAIRASCRLDWGRTARR
jgi:hypothetical protein